jgi:hypothetical protein
MSTDYERLIAATDWTLVPTMTSSSENEAIAGAAEALREVEVEAVKSAPSTMGGESLEQLSIDELRKLAATLDIPDRGQIVERDKLVAAIHKRMEQAAG